MAKEETTAVLAEKAEKKPAKTAAAKSEKKAENGILDRLLESGAHFGHQTKRWNPKMEKYIFGAKNGIYIIDLVQTASLLEEAKSFVQKIAADGGEILYVGTKRQARPILEACAKEVEMPYVTERWLGGMLTNFNTIAERIKRLKKLEQQREDNELTKLTKKERLGVDDEITSLNRIFGGIRDMRGEPAAIFVVDAPKETIAIAEAHKLGIPVVAILDTNANPDEVEVPIPANDDAIRSIKLITEEITDAVKTGKNAYEAKANAEANAEEIV